MDQELSDEWRLFANTYGQWLDRLMQLKNKTADNSLVSSPSNIELSKALVENCKRLTRTAIAKGNPPQEIETLDKQLEDLYILLLNYLQKVSHHEIDKRMQGNFECR